MRTKRQTTTAAAGKKKAKKSKYDSAWKKLIEGYLKYFLEFFFPHIYEAIDFTKEIHFLDKELQEIDPDSNIGDRTADVLVKVHLKTGGLAYIGIIIHIEVQSQPRPGLMKRMFIYYYRGFDKMIEKDIPMISVAILADDDPNYRLDEYCFSLLGFDIRMKIPVVKILDYKLKKELREKLETSKNPMAMIVKAQLKSHEVKGADNEAKFEVTKELIRQCYKNEYSKDVTRFIMKFFAWVIRVPESYKTRIKREIRKIEEDFKMEYIPLWERDARREGKREGKKETARQMLLDNMPIEKVVKYTGLTEKEVKALMH